MLDDGTSKIFLSTKGTLEDVEPSVKNFLDFVDGLPVQDRWVDEIQNLIIKLKHTEKEKVDYMTYHMKISEERDEARAEGRAEGEAKGIKAVISMAKNLSVSQPQVIEHLMINFDLTHDQAVAAVQANW